MRFETVQKIHQEIALALGVILIQGRLAGLYLYLIVKREQSWRTEIMFEFSNCSLSPLDIK